MKHKRGRVMTKAMETPAIGCGLVPRPYRQARACDNRASLALIPLPLLHHSLWIVTMNRCTLALFGRALLCLDFITSVNAVEAA
jgi:hypothetical protein